MENNITAEIIQYLEDVPNIKIGLQLFQGCAMMYWALLGSYMIRRYKYIPSKVWFTIFFSVLSVTAGLILETVYLDVRTALENWYWYISNYTVCYGIWKLIHYLEERTDSNLELKEITAVLDSIPLIIFVKDYETGVMLFSTESYKDEYGNYVHKKDDEHWLKFIADVFRRNDTETYNLKGNPKTFAEPISESEKEAVTKWTGKYVTDKGEERIALMGMQLQVYNNPNIKITENGKIIGKK